MSDPIGIEETLAYLRALYGPVPNTSGLETQVPDYADETDLGVLVPDENTPECQLKQRCSIPGEAQEGNGLPTSEETSGASCGLQNLSDDDWKERHYDARLEAEMDQEAQGMDDMGITTNEES